jgi:salicylate hydroxylase
MDSSSPFRVAIVGGGIGGLFCALALHHHVKHNIKIDVYEQAAQYREIGAGIGIAPNAARLFHEVGVGDRMNAIAGDRNGVWFTFRRADTGEEVVTVPSPETSKIRSVPMARSEFLDILIDAIKERHAADLHTSKHCVRLSEPSPDAVTLHFSDQTTAEANLVIGCDGIHSAIRAQFIADQPVYGGMIAYRGVIPIATLAPWPYSSYSAVWMSKGRHFLVFPISRNKSLNIVAFVTKPEAEVEDTKESWTSTCARQDIERDFVGFEDTVQRIIRQMPDPASKWRLNYREPLDTWVHLDGRVALVGDASHSMLPHQGAGAGQATEDGYILARCLNGFLSQTQRSSAGKEYKSLREWMHLYQTIRLPRAQKVARTSKQAGEVYEMLDEDLRDLPFDQCLPIVRDRIQERMKWIWTEDIGQAFDRAVTEHGL